MINLTSCKYIEEKMDSYSRIYEKYNNIKDYKANITMQVYGNKVVEEYQMTQYYKTPNMHRVEVNKPEEIKGLTTIYSKNSIIILNPELDTNYSLSNLNADNDNFIFLTDFFESYYKSEQVVVMAMKKENTKYTVLKTYIPGNRVHRHSQNLWIDNEKLLPYKMETYNIQGDKMILIYYNEIKLNIGLEDDIFNLNQCILDNTNAHNTSSRELVLLNLSKK